MKIISREEAIKKGLKKYFTGKPCKRGHKVGRYIRNGGCVKCNKDASPLYRGNYKKKLQSNQLKKVGGLINAWRSWNSKPYWKTKINTMERRCKLKKIKFNLDVNYMVNLTIKQNFMCYYSGAPLTPGMKKKKLYWKDAFTKLSVDRINPKLGYIKGNIALVSDFVNVMKGSLIHNEFISLMCLILSNHKILNPKVHQNNKNPIFRYLLKSHIKNARLAGKLLKKNTLLRATS